MKRFSRLVLLLPAIICCCHLYAQKQGQALIDSLLKELPKNKEDTNKVDVLNALSFNYNSSNPDEGIKYGQQELALATKLDWKKGIASANNALGTNYDTKSDFPKALGYFFTSLKMYEAIGDKRSVATVNGNIGITYAHQGDYPKVLEYFSKQLKADQEIGFNEGIAQVTCNIGNVYYTQGNYPAALEYYFNGLKIAEDIHNKNVSGDVTENIGSVYQAENNSQKALDYFFKAVQLMEDAGNKSGLSDATNNIGHAYFVLKDYVKALEYFFKALKIAEDIGNKGIAALVSGNLGETYTARGDYVTAMEYEYRALKTDEEIGDKYNAAWQLEHLGATLISMAKDTSRAGNVRRTEELPSGRYLPNGSIPTGKTAQVRQAIEYLNNSVDTGRKINAPDIIQACYENLAQAYKLTGDYKTALEAADNARAIKDSLFSKDNSEKIVKLGMQEEYKRVRLTDSLKMVEKEKITGLELQRQRGYTTMGIAGILLLVGFSFFIVKERGKSEKERKKSDELLLNILPGEVATELKATGATTAKQFDDVTVLFTDFVNFTNAGERMSPQALIDELHTCFKTFDDITSKYGVEKIKTIGDAYLAVAGLPTADPEHAENIVRAAIEINAFMQDRLAKLGERTFEIRIGIHSGSVVAGIVGVKKFAYDIWGDTVNTAARMEQNSEAGKINISQTTYELVRDKFACEYRGEIDAKGKGMLKMYFIV